LRTTSVDEFAIEARIDPRVDGMAHRRGFADQRMLVLRLARSPSTSTRPGSAHCALMNSTLPQETMLTCLCRALELEQDFVFDMQFQQNHIRRLQHRARPPTQRRAAALAFTGSNYGRLGTL